MLFLRWLLPFALIVIGMLPWLDAIQINRHVIRTETFQSPLFTLTPGSVTEKFYYDINFPRGHIAIKSFDADVVDEAGNPVPLFETYLHHWIIVRYYQHKNAAMPKTNVPLTKLHGSNFIIVGNDGVCQRGVLSQYYGMGTESRNTSTFLPHPYGIEVGNDAKVPTGYEERWLLNVHAIDTRGVEDRLGCIECRCDLYNVTQDQHGLPLTPDYKGGLKCCYDKAQCRVSESNKGEERNLYLRYTVKWVDWDDFVIPVKVYIFDATDTWKPLMDSTGQSQEHQCRIEYDVESCSLTNKLDGKCNAAKSSKLMFPDDGFLVYGVAHQHTGGIGATPTLYGEDERVLCSSSPIYGGGHEVGNEDGYVVGMSTCYPQLGYVRINKGEIGTLVSYYDSSQNHTGVMGLIQIVLADKMPNPSFHVEA